MKRLREKLRARRGLTLTEVLVAVLILSLLTVGIAAGVGASLGVYRQTTERSDGQMLASTLSAALMDELRYARDVQAHTTGSGEGAVTTVTFTSANFGEEASVGTDGRGHVTVGGQLLIGTGAYGKLTAEAVVRPAGGALRVELTIRNAGGETVETAEFSVAPLN